jgi:adenine-specific DNA glycosylase
MDFASWGRTRMRYDRKIVVRFQRRLIAWYGRHARDLPWRRTRAPYRILVSEVMLQQTQVDRVQQYYGRFLRRYPTFEALAAAPEVTSTPPANVAGVTVSRTVPAA